MFYATNRNEKFIIDLDCVHLSLVITAAQLHLTKPELRFCTGSNSNRDLSKICDGKNIWHWFGWKYGFKPFVNQPFLKNTPSSSPSSVVYETINTNLLGKALISRRFHEKCYLTCMCPNSRFAECISLVLLATCNTTKPLKSFPLIINGNLWGTVIEINL